MDAKPQRPVRAIKVRDENEPPLLTTSIHQRNKSTSAIATMPGPMTFKAAAKRTAFGDVSNTTGMGRTSKDDSVISNKPSNEKPERELQKMKSAALLRPAQRPLTVSSLKGLISSVTNSGNAENVSSKTTTDDSNPRKVLTKRNNSIFKDPTLPSVEEKTVQSKKETIAQSYVAPVYQSLVPRVMAQDSVVPVPHHQPVLPPTLDVSGSKEGKKELQDIPEAVKVVEKSAEVRSDGNSGGVFIDNNGKIQIYQDVPSPNVAAVKADAIAVDPLVTAPHVSSHCSILDLPQHSEPHMSHLNSEPSVPNHSALPSEPEEYWDDEEDGNYEEEGYVTARSYRSLGGNTTGGATTVLFPLVNQKIKREIAAAQSLVEASRTKEEVEDDCWDTSMVAEYSEEIFQYMRELEIKMLPNAHYMENQAEIQWSMRAVLMDWLVQVHHRFQLLPETLFLCVNYIDRFLSCKIVSLGKLQLVGATALFIAAKYEEINCPSLSEIVYMVDGGYTLDEVVKAERFMLSMLNFELGWPGPMSFLRRISKADDYDLETRTLAKYFLEITVMDERFVGSPPSYTAAGSHCLARMMLKKGHWTPAHVYYSNYTYSQLLPIVNLILECCDNPRKHHSAVYDKYCDKRYKKASIFAQSEIISTAQHLRLERELGYTPLLR